MTLGVTEDSNYTNIANAIRAMSASGTSQNMTPAEMAAAIRALKATWGSIDGDIADQTDLQNIFSSLSEYINLFYVNSKGTYDTGKGVTVTVNEDNSITLNGTPTADIAIANIMGGDYQTPVLTKNKTYICQRTLVSGTANGHPALRRVTTSGEVTVTLGEPFTPPSDEPLFIRIDRSVGTFTNAQYQFMVCEGDTLPSSYISHKATAVDTRVRKDVDLLTSNVRSNMNALQKRLALDISEMEIIYEDDDLNLKTIPGTYRIASTSIANTIKNIPVKSPGLLIILSPGTNAYRSQIFITTNNRYFIRFYSFSTKVFTDWSRIAYANEIIEHTHSFNFTEDTLVILRNDENLETVITDGDNANPISKILIPSGEERLLEDTEARKQIEYLKNNIGGINEIKVVWSKGHPGYVNTTIKTSRTTIIEVPKQGVTLKILADLQPFSPIRNICFRYTFRNQDGNIVYNRSSATGYDFIKYDPEMPYLTITYFIAGTSTIVPLQDNDIPISDYDIDNYIVAKIYSGEIKNNQFRPKPGIASFLSLNNIATSFVDDTVNANKELCYYLPLKNVNYISCDSKYSVFVKIYKYDPISNRSVFVKNLGLSVYNKYCGNGTNYVDLKEYKDNYYGIVFTSKSRINFNDTIIENITDQNRELDSTLGLEPYEPLYIDWDSNAEIVHHAKGGNKNIQENINLIKSIKVRRPFISVSPNRSNGIKSLTPSENFSGVFYYGDPTFYWYVSPQAYFTAVQNPCSLAYSNFENDGAGRKYGTHCSAFASLLMGLEIPNLVFGYKYLSKYTYNIKKLDLNNDVYQIERNDVAFYAVRSSGHIVMYNDIFSIDGTPYLDMYQAIHPATIHNSMPLSNAFGTTNTLSDKYKYLLKSKDNTDKIGRIAEKSNWNVPYTDAEWIAMNNRGYGSIYLKNNTSCYITFKDNTMSFKLSLDDVILGTYNVADFNPTEMNEYYICDITNIILETGQYKLINVSDDTVLDMFYVIAPQSITVTYELTDHNTVVFNSNEFNSIDWIGIQYADNSGSGRINFKWGDSDTVEIPIRLESIYDTYAETNTTRISNAIIAVNSGIDDQRYTMRINTGEVNL